MTQAFLEMIIKLRLAICKMRSRIQPVEPSSHGIRKIICLSSSRSAVKLQHASYGPIPMINITEGVVLAPQSRYRHCADLSSHRRRRRIESYDLQHIAHLI